MVSMLTRFVVVLAMTLGLSVTAVTTYVAPAQAACVDNSGEPCKAAKKAARKFSHGKMRNSHDFEFSGHMKKLIRKWYRQHPHARAARLASGDWWKWPFEQAACSPMFGPGYRANCEAGAEHQREFFEKTQEVYKVMVWCGGAAIIGALGGGGYVGAGRGAAACFWSKAIGLW